MENPLEYTSFLIRLWRELPEATKPSVTDRGWLVQVEHIPSGEQAYFSSLEDLFVFIRGRLADLQAPRSNGPEPKNVFIARKQSSEQDPEGDPK